MASDFSNANVSGNCCLPIDEIVVWLRAHLGPGSHVYFIDACRNTLDGSAITISNQILPFSTNAGTEASTFVLHSTTDGRTTPVGGPFHPKLMEGLQGKGRAKVWDDTDADLINVQYSSLRRYLKSVLKDPVDGEMDGTADDMTLAWLKPAPDTTCTITIEGGKVPDGTIAYRRGRDTRRRTAGPRHEDRPEAQADAYTFSVRAAKTIFEQSELRQELYDDSTITFRIAYLEAPLPPRPASADWKIWGFGQSGRAANWAQPFRPEKCLNWPLSEPMRSTERWTSSCLPAARRINQCQFKSPDNVSGVREGKRRGRRLYGHPQGSGRANHRTQRHRCFSWVRRRTGPRAWRHSTPMSLSRRASR